MAAVLEGFEFTNPAASTEAATPVGQLIDELCEDIDEAYREKLEKLLGHVRNGRLKAGAGIARELYHLLDDHARLGL